MKYFIITVVVIVLLLSVGLVVPFVISLGAEPKSLTAVERSAQIEGLSLQSAQANLKVIAELQKHGRAFAL